MTLDLVLQRIDLALQEGRQADALEHLEKAVADERREIRRALLADLDAWAGADPHHWGDEVGDADLRAMVDRIVPEP